MTLREHALPTVIILHPNDGCLSIARALGRRGVDVQALATPKYAHLLRSRFLSGEVLPDVAREPGAWIDALHASADGREAAVLCGSDAATEFVTRHRRRLAPALRTFEGTDGVHVELMDKLRLYRTAAEAGVRAPWARHVESRLDLDTVLPRIPYPCVLKPRLGHRAKELLGMGTTIVTGRTELVDRAARLLDHGLDLLLTEVVPGPETGLEGAVTVRDAEGRYTLEYGRHKVRQWPLDTGVGSLIEAADVPETLAMNRRLMEHSGYHGIAATETKRHAETGELYLIEINVRVPASFGLAQACGVDGAWRLYATLAGLPLDDQAAQVHGRKVVLPDKDVRSAWQRLRRGDATAAAVLRSWRGTRDFGVLDARDPMPAVAMAGRLLRPLPAAPAPAPQVRPAAPAAAAAPAVPAGPAEPVLPQQPSPVERVAAARTLKAARRGPAVPCPVEPAGAPPATPRRDTAPVAPAVERA